MVVFTCNNCGDSLQKPKVAKHYQFQCRTSENLTCVDCHKDFYGQDYVAHTKCITESERYGGQNYVAKPGQNKGERKQQEWINVVKNVIETAENLTKEEQNILNILSRHENIPRKKAKFLNFIRSVMGNRLNMPVIESVWSRMETAFKTAVESNKPENQTGNGKVKEEVKKETDDTSIADNQENSIVENQNNENISRENVSSNGNGAEVTGAVKKNKKSKKRDSTEVAATEENEPPKKKQKKKSELIVEETTVVTSSQDNGDIGKFDWKATIIETVASNEGIKLKKLRKRIAALYVNHCSDSVTFEKAASKFDKKLPKITEVSINEDRVRIA